MRRKLDVTRDDLMQLREKGYSNKDIANMLEISYATVLRYIGNQGCRMESVTKTPERSETTPQMPSVQLIRQTVAANGYGFEINCAEKTLNITSPLGGTICIRADDADEFIRALNAVRYYLV